MAPMLLFLFVAVALVLGAWGVAAPIIWTVGIVGGFIALFAFIAIDS